MVPLGNFGYVFRDMNEGLTNLEEVMKILDQKAEIKDKPGASDIMLTEGNIIFDNVTFGYDVRRPVLNAVSFKIPAKKTVAIVGPTGSGKTTIAKLLFRFYDVTEGKILIDDIDITNINQKSLQSIMGVVPQHTALFNETIRYNIAYGRPDVSDEEIQTAIKRSHLDKFILSLPDGLNTIVGEHGFKLSGGERQRIAIARVLLKNPPILIFDEATSSLDTKTEHLIQKNIEEVSGDATTIIIAHRLSTIVHADLIIVLENGRIIEKGTHQELLESGSLYSQLWNKQNHEQKK
jgi:ATP-binding cassette subfamily B protein